MSRKKKWDTLLCPEEPSRVCFYERQGRVLYYENPTVYFYRGLNRVYLIIVTMTLRSGAKQAISCGLIGPIHCAVLPLG